MKLRIVLEPSDEGGFTVYVPALPGCISEGDSREEALVNIREAIEGYEAALEEIEADPKFIEMMKRSDEDIRAGRVHTQEEVERMIQRKKKRR